MKFTSVSAVTILAAISAVQAAPLSVHSSAVAVDLLPRNGISALSKKGETVGDFEAEEEKKAKALEAQGVPEDRRLKARAKAETVGEILAEEEKEFQEEDIPEDRKLKARTKTETVGEVWAEEEKKTQEEGLLEDRKLKIRTVCGQVDFSGGKPVQLEDRELCHGQEIDPTPAKFADLEDRAVSKEAKDELDRIRAGIATEPRLED
ncbi:uncharacterized protein ColSpa_02852 [Colletotrichum spaethianum]|uniref:Uncharacterized protein n=1 Tax=Colletotrichum spaethianum TaxID=700344 RepID=A0AA37L605_9PEZI|nr:uncharacterized protein ColSpa_02852 [Colletotrichum spaethianum]GKT42671.1 hypothetical protein ColSpa_02852 [Colletotrichum spaethianum]